MDKIEFENRKKEIRSVIIADEYIKSLEQSIGTEKTKEQSQLPNESEPSMKVSVSGRDFKITNEIAHAFIDLIDRIDYAYLQIGEKKVYGDLHNAVSDKVIFIKKLLRSSNE